MKLSTRSRYGIRLLYELALNYGKGYIFLKDISQRQEISEKYLGQLIIPLRTAGFVNSSRGAHGGYSLARDPEKINLYDVVNVLEGSMCIVDCVKEPSVCSRTEICPTRGIWEQFDLSIRNFLEKITLQTLVENQKAGDSEHLMYNI